MSDSQKPSETPRRTFEPSRPKLLCAADIEPIEMRWLWFPYIPMGTASMIFGPGGIGKSHIACEIASALTSGRPLPGQNGVRRREQKVLFMTAEDDPAVVLQPRLVKAGADLTRIFIPEESFILDRAGIATVEHYMREVAATIVFIDPIVAYMGGKIDMNRMNEVRMLTGALSRAARDSGSAVIIIHHSRKGKEGRDSEKAAGSADFINAVRSTLYACLAKDGTRLLRHVKSNYAKEGPTLAFAFDNDQFRWVGEYDEAGAAEREEGGARTQSARELIQEALLNGPVEAVVVQQLADDAGISLSTLNRAKHGLAKSTLHYAGDRKVWYWELEK